MRDHLCERCAVLVDERVGLHVGAVTMGMEALDTIRVIRPQLLYGDTAAERVRIDEWWRRSVLTRRGPRAILVDVPFFLAGDRT